MSKPENEIEAAGGRSDSTAVSGDTHPDLENLGQALVDLGRAMQDKNTTISELAALSFKAGLQIQFRIT